MAAPPFLPDETKPGSSDLISLFPSVEQTFRDVIEDWILVEHNTNGTHKQVTLDDISTPTIATALVGIWHEDGVLKTRFATGTVYDVLTTEGGTLVGDLVLAGAPDADLKASTKKYVDDTVAALAPLASPALTGNPTAPTQAVGNDSTRLATTAFVKAHVLKYDSGSLSWSTGSFVSVSHGLGAQPDFFQVTFVCTSSDNGWAVGDEIWCDREKDTTTTASSVAMMASSTKLRVSMRDVVGQAVSKNGTAIFIIQPAKWKVRLRAVRFT